QQRAAVRRSVVVVCAPAPAARSTRTTPARAPRTRPASAVVGARDCLLMVVAAGDVRPCRAMACIAPVPRRCPSRDAQRADGGSAAPACPVAAGAATRLYRPGAYGHAVAGRRSACRQHAAVDAALLAAARHRG